MISQASRQSHELIVACKALHVPVAERRDRRRPHRPLFLPTTTDKGCSMSIYILHIHHTTRVKTRRGDSAPKSIIHAGLSSVVHSTMCFGG